ncbi:MAG TPA: hypothetical protein VK840_05700 [Candidatus Dormibacteraeota bacterium]|jgi:hypothetical protein|nr:hypothetical protein [Candidatus Dormibacteraeota bacterium]
MRVSYFVTVMVVILLGCSHRDSIDRLMDKVPYEEVPSYLFMPIQLPETASPEQLISVLTKRGEFHNPKILQTRHVHTTPRPKDQIPVESYTAVLLDTNPGRKIVLLQPQSFKGRWHGWYYKIYDAE